MVFQQAYNPTRSERGVLLLCFMVSVQSQNIIFMIITAHLRAVHKAQVPTSTELPLQLYSFAREATQIIHGHMESLREMNWT